MSSPVQCALWTLELSFVLPVHIALRLAFRYGINAIDTSPYYYPSEFVLGRLLAALAPEYPRHTYYLCTKAGRYGPNVSEFDYSPQKIRSSVEASLKRLGTSYLDLVYLHDAEFVAEKVGDGQESGFAAAQAVQDSSEGEEVRRRLGLDAASSDKIHGPGDETLLAAVAELQKLKAEGKVRQVGISGYPLPALLRLSRLVASTAPFQPLDAILSYSNHTLHSDLLPAYLNLFREEPAARKQQRGNGQGNLDAYKSPTVLNGSPFSMGLLTDAGPPEWHPASQELRAACRVAADDIKATTNEGNKDDSAGSSPATLANTALLFGIRGSEQVVKGTGQVRLRTLLGMSTPQQVHDAIEAFRVLSTGSTGQSDDKARFALYQRQLQNEAIVKRHVAEAGATDWSWASPPPEAYQ